MHVTQIKYLGADGKVIKHGIAGTWIADPNPHHAKIVKKWWGVVSLFHVCATEGYLDAAMYYHRMGVELWERMNPSQREQGNHYLSKPLPIGARLV